MRSHFPYDVIDDAPNDTLRDSKIGSQFCLSDHASGVDGADFINSNPVQFCVPVAFTNLSSSIEHPVFCILLNSSPTKVLPVETQLVVADHRGMKGLHPRRPWAMVSFAGKDMNRMAATIKPNSSIAASCMKRPQNTVVGQLIYPEVVIRKRFTVGGSTTAATKWITIMPSSTCVVFHAPAKGHADVGASWDSTFGGGAATTKRITVVSTGSQTVQVAPAFGSVRIGTPRHIAASWDSVIHQPADRLSRFGGQVPLGVCAPGGTALFPSNSTRDW